MKNCSKCYQGVVSAPNYNVASTCEQPPTQLETVKIPKTKGGDGPNDPYAPKLGAWQNTIVQYEKTGSVYLYDVNGVYTNLTGTDYAAQILALQDSVTAQGDMLQELDQDLLDEKNARIEAIGTLSSAVASLNQALDTETTTRKDADDGLASQIAGFNAQLNDLGKQVGDNATDLAADVANLQTNINQLANKEAEDVADLQTNINKNADDIANLTAAVGGNVGDMSKELVINAAVSSTATTATLTLTKGNLATTDTTAEELALPFASETNAGVLSAEDYARIGSGGSEYSIPEVTVGDTVSEWGNLLSWGYAGEDLRPSLKVYNTTTGGKTNVLQGNAVPLVNADHAGVMSPTDKNKLDELADIKSIGSGLNLSTAGVLSAVASGSTPLIQKASATIHITGSNNPGAGIEFPTPYAETPAVIVNAVMPESLIGQGPTTVALPEVVITELDRFHVRVKAVYDTAKEYPQFAVHLTAIGT